MNKLKKTLALVAAMGLACTAFVGCGSSSDSSSTSEDTTKAASADTTAADDTSAADESSAEGDSSSSDWTAADSSLADDGADLTIIAWNTNDLANMFEQYVGDKSGGTDANGVNVTYNLVGSSGTEAMEQYTTYFDGGEDCDLYAAEAGWILEYITDSNYASPLSEIGLDTADYTNAYQYTLDTATVDGTLMGATWQAAPGGYVYRTDLAESYLGVTSPEEMQAKISDWDSFWATAEEVKTASDGKTRMAATAAGVWQAYSTAMNKTWVGSDGVLDTTGCEDYATMIKNAIDNGYVDETEQWGDAWFAEGQDDSTFGYFFSTWCLTSGAQLEQASGGENGATYGLWNIVEGPADYFWGGTWLVVSPSCDNVTAAHDFVKYFTVDTDAMQEYAETYGDFVNNKEAMDAVASGDYSNPALGGQNQFAVLKDVADGITLSDTATKYDQTCKDAFNEAVTNNWGADSDTIMTDFKTRLASKTGDITIK